MSSCFNIKACHQAHKCYTCLRCQKPTLHLLLMQITHQAQIAPSFQRLDAMHLPSPRHQPRILSSAMPAFAASPPLSHRRPRVGSIPRRPASICACTPPPAAPPTPTAPIPSSLSDAASQAIAASQAFLLSGQRRAFITIDTTAGDETYTLLKNSLPCVRLLLPLLAGAEAGETGETAETGETGETAETAETASAVPVLLPDAGAAALASRDWETEGPDVPVGVRLEGIGRWQLAEGEDVAGVFIVAPRASEVEDLELAVEESGNLPIVVVNPDLVDMGVTGLSLNARQLRERVIDTFETTYYLKTFGWGVLLRAYPGDWGLWVDDADELSGFRCIKSFPSRPSTEDIDDCLDADADAKNGGGPSASGGFMRKLTRFVKLYSQG